MAMIDILILAVVQALTEFIPVSSSGHLLAIEQLTSIESSLAIDVMLHFGTLIALLLYFRERLLVIVRDLISNRSSALAVNIIISTIPAAVFGFFFDDFLLDSARTILVVIGMLSIVGLAMIFEDRLFARVRKRAVSKMTRGSAAVIGAMQAIALIPGTSRSGITMLAGRSQGLNSKDAAEYSFLIGIPIIAGATLKVLTEDATRRYLSNNFVEAAMGIAVAAIVGRIVLGLLLNYVAQKGLRIFGWYRLLLAALLFIIWLNS